MGDSSGGVRMSHHLAGRWKLLTSHNFDQFLEEIGVNIVARQIASRAKPCIDIQHENDAFTIRTVEGPFTPDEVFTVGKTTSIIEPDGRKLDVRAVWSDSGLVVHYAPTTGPSSVPYTVTRTQTLDERLIVKMESGGIVSTRVFEKIGA